ncbi:MAG: hypothetical protein ACK49V_05450, partial [Actinomycetes bacterium]
MADNAVEIDVLIKRIASAGEDVERSVAELATAAAAAGMDVVLFDQRTLGASERLEITTATGALVKARDDASTARLQVRELDDERTTAQASASNLARTIGIEDEGLTRLDVIESQLPELINRAGRWLEDTATVVNDEAQLAGMVER